jgi:uncharacterized LabA/DUF88 family protein
LRTIVYVDGFNLYYGCLKGTPYRWLNIAELCRLLLPKSQIIQIKYFTARVKGRPDDPDQSVRQQVYLRALNTLPNFAIYYGRFQSHPVRMHLANPPATGSKTVEVMKTEEKGSDVNIATHLLIDAFNKKSDMAVLISNDSDLLEPIRYVIQDMKVPVQILNPQKDPSKQLKAVVNIINPIRAGVLGVSQFPPVMTDAKGTFYKPKAW